MKIYKLERKQQLPINIKQAWSFFSNPYNLPVITPKSLKFRIISNPPEIVYPGLLIEYRVSPLFGISMGWLTEITQAKENKYFIDEQRYGPYQMWHHEHFFEENESGTMMRDCILYKLPFEFFSQLIHPFLVQKQLNQIFDFREKKLIELFNK